MKLKTESCCNLGAEFDKKKNVLYETDNFFVVPTIGQMGIEGYVLLCSKNHFMGVGGLPKELHTELEEVLETTRKILSETYKSKVLTFEHGPRVGCYKGGGCLDHSHLHVLPVCENIMKPLVLNLLKSLQVKDFYKIERIKDFKRLKQIYDKQEASYLFIETANLERYTTEVNFVIPSQYLRQTLAVNLNRVNNWDWRTSPDLKTFEKTIDTLEKRF